MRATRETRPVAFHGEGPIWWGGLHWLDMLAGDVLSLNPDGSVTRRHVSSVVAAIRPRADGGFVYAVERGFAVDRLDGADLPLHLPQLWADPGVRMNERGCDPHGRFYCGSMAYDQTPGAAAMYRLDPDGTSSQVLTHLTVSNGLEWSPDGTLAYYIDSATGRIDKLEDDPQRGLINRRPLAAVDQGVPDGLTVDSEGGIWVALWGGGAVHRYSPTGELTALVEVPVRNVTACIFGGQDLRTLYITTSRQGSTSQDEPQAGAVFSATPGVTGVPLRPFRG